MARVTGLEQQLHEAQAEAAALQISINRFTSIETQLKVTISEEERAAEEEVGGSIESGFARLKARSAAAAGCIKNDDDEELQIVSATAAPEPGFRAGGPPEEDR